MLKVDINLKDGTKLRFQGEEAERAKNINYDEYGDLIFFGDVAIVPRDNLSNYYCRKETLNEIDENNNSQKIIVTIDGKEVGTIVLEKLAKRLAENITDKS